MTIGRDLGNRRSRLYQCIAVFVAWGFLTLPARGAEDWLDDMPDVATVARVVQQEYHKGPDDQDRTATHLAMALILLRQIMHYQADTEPQMSPARKARMHELANAYLEAELALGRGMGKRRGALSEPEVHRFYETRRYEKCETWDCYLYWTRFQLESWNAFNFRKRLLPLLFPCGRADQFMALAAKNALSAPLIPFTPAAPLPRDAAAMARLSRTTSAAADCPQDSGDIDGDGRCFEWEKKPTALAANAVAQQCAPPVLEKVRTAPGGGLRVTFVPGTAQAGMTVRLRAVRSNQSQIGAGNATLWSGDTVIQYGPAGEAEAIIAQGVSLNPDPARPYLVVEAAGGSAGKPVSCEQPLTVWLKRQLGVTPQGRLNPEGLHGPYTHADIAALSTANIALDMTNAYECGFLIGRNMFSKERGYYTTPPICGTSDDEFSQENYLKTHRKAFENSCEDPLHFALAASVHTHPKSPVAVIDERNDYFSMKDFDGAVKQKHNDQNFEKIYMVSKRSRCVESFEPTVDDRVFTFAEKNLMSVAGQIPAFAPLYLDYVGRMVTIKCY